MLTLVAGCYAVSQKVFAVQYDRLTITFAFALACVPVVYSLLVQHWGVFDLILRFLMCAGIAAAAMYWLQARCIVRLLSWTQRPVIPGGNRTWM